MTGPQLQPLHHHHHQQQQQQRQLPHNQHDDDRHDDQHDQDQQHVQHDDDQQQQQQHKNKKHLVSFSPRTAEKEHSIPTVLKIVGPITSAWDATKEWLVATGQAQRLPVKEDSPGLEKNDVMDKWLGKTFVTTIPPSIPMVLFVYSVY